jgi:predicted ATPase
MMLAGDAGIGKTWIAREAARLAASRGTVVLWGSCLEGDWQPPYGPWVEVLAECVRTSEAASLGRALGPGASALAQIVPEIRVLLPDTPPAPPLNPAEERLRLYEALTQFLLGLSRQNPVLLILDDLHWADHDSLGLLRSLARFVPRSRLLVLGTYRDVEVDLAREHPLTELLAGLHREAAYQHIVVRGLSLPEVADFLAHWAGQPLPAGLVEAIYAQTGGNPFYVREVFRHLLEERKILQRAGRWSTDFSLEELGIPEGVRRVIERRVACLSEATGRMLRLAAAFRGGFSFPALQTLLDLPEEALLTCLDEALAAGLLCVAEGPTPRYDFAHAIVRQTLYDRLNPDRRARLHHRIAHALRRVYAGQESSHAAEIAAQYHASAGLPGAAEGVPHALAAAEQASAGYAHDRAVTLLRMARDLSTEGEPGAGAEILCRLAVAEAEALLLADSRQTAEGALSALVGGGGGCRAVYTGIFPRADRAGAEGGRGRPLPLGTAGRARTIPVRRGARSHLGEADAPSR